MFWRTIDNIQYYYDSQRPELSFESNDSAPTYTEIQDREEQVVANNQEQMEEDSCPASPLSQDALHGKMAVQIADDFEIFPKGTEMTNSMSRFLTLEWQQRTTLLLSLSGRKNVRAQTKALTQTKKSSLLICTSQDGSPDVVPLNANGPGDNTGTPNRVATTFSNERDCQNIQPERFLKVDQLHAYAIIIWHLEETLADQNPPPLRLNINGEGGTGKSKLIEAITNYFASRDASHLLVKWRTQVSQPRIFKA
ncbi:hypothetical protein OG21DRAFT_1528133 [Imleria badia]|nr:hypothetical protein OG21DRAFT_1528133 [Imleria badia]